MDHGSRFDDYRARPDQPGGLIFSPVPNEGKRDRGSSNPCPHRDVAKRERDPRRRRQQARTCVLEGAQSPASEATAFPPSGSLLLRSRSQASSRITVYSRKPRLHPNSVFASRRCSAGVPASLSFRSGPGPRWAIASRSSKSCGSLNATRVTGPRCFRCSPGHRGSSRIRYFRDLLRRDLEMHLMRCTPHRMHACTLAAGRASHGEPRRTRAEAS